MNSLNYCRRNASLCDDFIEQSKKTWNWLETSNIIGITLSEETLTDLNLIELQSKHPYEINTKKYSKWVEGKKTGADWEWWLTENGYWLGLRVQAKRLDSTTLVYPQLKPGNTRQIDRLIDRALNDTPMCIPMYVFYNYWDKNLFNPSWKCGSYTKCIEMLGCSLSHAEYVRNVIISKRNNISSIDNIVYPWSCLVCCYGYSDEQDLPRRAFDFILGAFPKVDDKYRLRKDFVTETPPQYVYKIMEGTSLPDEFWRELNLNRITILHKKQTTQ